jgi:uncharacterized membrane protein
MLRRALTLLAVIGFGVAGYLTYIHYAGIRPVCTAGQSCEIVQTSAWSELLGIPVALLGFLTYVAILGTLFAPDREETRLLTLAITLVGFSFSAYLTYREKYSIHHYCEWCLSSAVIMTLLFLGSVVRFLRPDGSGSAVLAPEVAIDSH